MPRNTTLLHTIIVTILVSLSGTVAAAENSIQSQPTAVNSESIKSGSITTLKTSKPPQKQPNILFILLDNIGKDWFRCYGSQENVTPNIDRLARTGVKFRNFYVTPVCSTTRVGLLTGRYPYRTGWHTHHDPAIYGGGYFDWNREISIARILKNAGYQTFISGKWQINDLFDPAQKDALAKHGFDEYCIFPEGKKEHPAHKKRYWDPYIIENGKRLETTGQYGPEIFTAKLIEFMTRQKEKSDQPFFAYYPAILTHLSIGPTPDNKVTNGRKLSDRELFVGMAQYADTLVGRMVSALDSLGLRDNTIVIVATDNGTDDGSYHGYDNLAGRVNGRYAEIGSTMKPNDDGYYPLTEWGINMPLIVNSPKHIPGGRESDDLIDMTDILPTIADLGQAKISTAIKIDGRSFAPQLRNPNHDKAWRTWCLSQYCEVRVVRNQRFKLFSSGQFYDLSVDPREQNDLQGSVELSNDQTTKSAHRNLRKILDDLPANAKLPWEFRSISARQIQAAKQ